MSTRFTLILLLILSLAIGSIGCSSSPKMGPMELGVEQFEHEDYEAAKSSFSLVMEKEPENPSPTYYMGRIALTEGNDEKAIEWLEKSIALDPNQSDYHFWLARACLERIQKVSFMEKGQLAPKILFELDKAVELDPNNVMARLYLGGFYLNAPPIAGGSVLKAKEQGEAVVELDPVKGHNFMAQIYLKEKDFDAAENSYQSLLELEPDNADTYYGLAMSYQAAEAYDKAFQTFEKALEIDPDHVASMYQIGRTAIFSGTNFERAEACLNLYLSRDIEPGQPTQASAHWRLGMLYEKNSKIELARAEYEAALALEPDNKEAKKSLEGLDDPE